MTDPEIQQFAKLVGARVVGKIPGPLHGALGAANMAHYYQQRMQELQARQPAPTGTGEERKPLAVSIQTPTKVSLDQLAAVGSSTAQPLDAESVAATVLDAVVAKIASQVHGPGQLESLLTRLGFDDVRSPAT